MAMCETCKNEPATVCYGGVQWLCHRCYVSFFHATTDMKPQSVARFASGLQLDDDDEA